MTEDEQIQALAPGQAIAFDWPEERYFSDRAALTRSALGLLPFKPLEFGAWVRGEKLRGDENDDMRFGKALHAAVLEPERFAASMLPRPAKPKDARKGAAAGTPERVAWELWERATKAFAATKSANPSAIPVSPDDQARIIGIREAIARHDEASVLLSPGGESEKTIIWREPITGLLVKVRVDLMRRLDAIDVYGTRLPPGYYDADIKTTAADSPGLFVASARKFGYLPQASMYLDASEALTGERMQWAWVATTAEPDRNGQHGVSVYVLTDEQRERGRQIYMNQLVEALDRITRDDWTPAHRKGVHTLPL
jgi:hypothetical protein